MGKTNVIQLWLSLLPPNKVTFFNSVRLVPLYPVVPQVVLNPLQGILQILCNPERFIPARYMWCTFENKAKTKTKTKTKQKKATITH